MLGAEMVEPIACRQALIDVAKQILGVTLSSWAADVPEPSESVH